MNIGDRIAVTPYIGEKDNIQHGTVVYINKTHNYYTVRLDAGYCQSFKEGTSE